MRSTSFKHLTMLALIGGSALLAACQSSTSTQAGANAQVSAPSDLVVTTAEPETEVTYTCETGVEISADYANPEQVVLNYGENPWTLTRERTASGTRYSNDEVIWMTKGEQGMLVANNGSGMEGQKLETCQQDI